MWRRIRPKEEPWMSLSNDISQCLSIVRCFRHRFAKVPRLPSPIIHDELEVVCRNCATNGGTALLDCFHCCTRRGMFQNYLETREGSVKAVQPGKEGLLSVKDCCVLSCLVEWKCRRELVDLRSRDLKEPHRGDSKPCPLPALPQRWDNTRRRIQCLHQSWW